MHTGESAYLAIDIGASKTLLAAFSDDGQVLKEHRFPTPKDYTKFLDELSGSVKTEFANYRFIAAGCAIPGRLDRSRGLGKDFGNLDWKNVPIAQDIKTALDGLPVSIENDANLAGLSEAVLVRDQYKKVLYLTLSTGIGDGIIVDGKIDPGLADSEAGHMVIEHDGKVEIWENLASGRALKARFGMLAKDINDPKVWQQFAGLLALGLNELLAVVQPDVVIIGGSVGNYFERFGDFLTAELKQHPRKMVDVPPIVKAKRPEEAVIYGCYEFVKQVS